MTDYQVLYSLINEIDELIERGATSGDVKFITWHEKTRRFLIKKYGNDSTEAARFGITHFSPENVNPNNPKRSYQLACHSGLLKTKGLLQAYISEIADEDIPAKPEKNEVTEVCDYTSAFIVHGHNGEMKEAVARVLEKQGINAIILHEQTNGGKTIIEKFENNCNVQAAICLFTADDLGKAKGSDEYNKRARQNVVLETGFFMGKISRKKVIVIADEGIEFPSDLQGIVYTSSSNWRFELLKELRDIGYNVDMNKL